MLAGAIFTAIKGAFGPAPQIDAKAPIDLVLRLFALAHRQQIPCFVLSRLGHPPAFQRRSRGIAPAFSGKAAHYNRGGREVNFADYSAAAVRAARRRSLKSRRRFRSRIAFGVTSTSSSSPIHAIASSRLICTGGVSRTASSFDVVRILVSCFPLIGLTSRSLS